MRYRTITLAAALAIFPAILRAHDYSILLRVWNHAVQPITLKSHDLNVKCGRFFPPDTIGRYTISNVTCTSSGDYPDGRLTYQKVLGDKTYSIRMAFLMYDRGEFSDKRASCTVMPKSDAVTCEAEISGGCDASHSCKFTVLFTVKGE